MAMFFYKIILNFYKLCYKIVKMRFFVDDTAVHDGFQQLLQGFTQRRSLQSEGFQVVSVYGQVFQGEAGVFRQQRIQGVHPLRHTRVLPFPGGMAGGDAVRPVDHEQCPEILFPKPVQPPEQKGAVQIHFAGIRPERDVMKADKTDYPVRGLTVAAQVAGNAFRDHGRRRLVAPVMRLALRIDRADSRLSGVVQKHGQAEIRFGRDVLNPLNGVLPKVIMMMVVLLIIADHGGNLRNDDGKHIRIIPQDAAGTGAAQQLQQFLPDPFTCHIFHGRGEKPQRFIRFGINGEIIDRSETQGPEDPEGVLTEAFPGDTDTPDDPAGEIFLPAKEIHQAGGGRIGHRVDSKIPAGQIPGYIAHKGDRIRMAVIGVASVSAESGDLIWNVTDYDGEGAVLQAGFHHVLTAEDFLHLLRTGGGAEIPVMGLYGQKGITNTAAYGIGGKTSLLQPGDKVRYRARQFHT